MLNKLNIYILLFILIYYSGPVLSTEINPWTLSITERIINRKNVSHIIIETRTDHYRVTLLVSDRFPYNYKAKSYPLFFKVDTVNKANSLANLLDADLESGNNYYIKLNGSQIIDYQPIQP